MQALVNELWHTSQPVVIVARRENMSVFRFFDQGDADHAIARWPWVVCGGLLALDYWRTYHGRDDF